MHGLFILSEYMWNAIGYDGPKCQNILGENDHSHKLSWEKRSREKILSNQIYGVESLKNVQKNIK